MHLDIENARLLYKSESATESSTDIFSREAFAKDASPLDKAVAFAEKNPVAVTIGAIAIAGATFAVTRARWSMGLDAVFDSSESIASNLTASSEKVATRGLSLEPLNSAEKYVCDESALLRAHSPKSPGQYPADGVGMRGSAKTEGGRVPPGPDHGPDPHGPDPHGPDPHGPDPNGETHPRRRLF